MVNKSRKKNKGKQLAAAAQKNEDQGPSQVDTSIGNNTTSMSESSNRSNSLLDSACISSPTIPINQTIGSNAASVEKKGKQSTETSAKKTNKNKNPVKVDTSRSNVDTNDSSSQLDSSYLSTSKSMRTNQSAESNVTSTEKKGKQSTETPAKKTNKNKNPVKVDTSRSNVDTNDSSSQLDSSYLSTSKSMRTNQSTESNVTSTEKKGKNDKNRTEEVSRDQSEELEQQMPSLSLAESFKTPAKEVGRSDTKQQKSDGKVPHVNQLEMSREGISDEYTSEAMESDVANHSDDFQTMRRKKKGKNREKQQVPVDQLPRGSYQSLPKYSSTPAKETKVTNTGNLTSLQESNAWTVGKKPWSTTNYYSQPTNKNPPGRSATNLDNHRGRETIETNHFPIKFENLPPFFYHYSVKFDSEDDKRFNRILLQNFIKIHCGDCITAFDGVSNVYSTSELFTNDSKKEAVITLELRNEPVNFNVKMTIAKKISTEPLKKYSPQAISQEITQCLNIVLGYALQSLGYKLIDQVYISETAVGNFLEKGMEMKHGLFQSVVFGSQPFLNIYAKQKAFPAQQSAAETMLQLLPKTCNSNSELTDTHLKRLESFLKSLRIEYTMKDGRKKTYFVTTLGLSSREATFNQNGTKTTVERYCQTERNSNMRYPYLPCLSVQFKPGHHGIRDPPILLPPEYCKIIGGKLPDSFVTEISPQMIKLSGPPSDRKQKIIQSFPHAAINQNACVQKFGISVDNVFKKVEYKILTPPTLVYCSKQNVKPDSKAQWFLKQFHTDAARTCPRRISWAIIDLTGRINETYFDKFKEMMYRGCGEAGLTIENHKSKSVSVNQGHIGNFQKILIDKKNYNLVFVIIRDDQNNNNYGKIKSIAENSVGCLTQCIRLQTFEKILKSNSTSRSSLIDNIAQKINAKLNGTNHILADDHQLDIKWPFMIMGADVTHPTSGSGRNSIAAVTASYDKNAFHYNIYYRSQDGKMETIRDLGTMTREQLEYFQKKNPRELPSTIMFYRDGVSDGEFQKTYEEEIQAIKEACKAFRPGYQPKITFLVVQKRHHTRLFPTTSNSIGNVPVGTIVDTTITHPTLTTFYLLSHHTNTQKLARPSKYVLLHDENDFNIDLLENITFRLCHLFSRCTKSVSYPAPTYYAHLAAARVKAYLNGRRPEENELDDPHINFKDAHPMFFV